MASKKIIAAFAVVSAALLGANLASLGAAGLWPVDVVEHWKAAAISVFSPAPETRTLLADPIVAFAASGRPEYLTSSAQEGQVLPNTLLIEPGVYEFMGESYELVEDGIYWFVAPGLENAQRILFNGDVATLMSSIAWLSSHGNGDDVRTPAEIAQLAKTRKVEVTCGVISSLAQTILDSVGIESRIAVTMTLDKWNAFDNGHTMIEVLVDGEWLLYDLDRNSRFLDKQTGAQLSLVEFVARVPDQNYEIMLLNRSPHITTSGFSMPEGYDLSLYSQIVYARPKTWFSRVAQVALIQTEDRQSYIFSSGVYDERLSSYSTAYHPVTAEQFAAFYR